MVEQCDWTSKKIDKFIILNKRLGKGRSGTVFRGQFEEDEKKQVAVKQIHFQNSPEKMKQLINQKVQNLQELDSKYIMKLYGVSRTPNNLFLFLEYCNDDDLRQYLKKKKGGYLSEHESIQFFKQIVEGMKEFQKHQIIHGELKSANIMLSDGRVKISDFGISEIIESFTKRYSTYVECPLHKSPEILEEVKYSSKCDVWSLGLVFYEMLYGKPPWTDRYQQKLLQNIRYKPLEFPAEPVRSDRVKNLIKKMLEFYEKDRVSWQDIFNDDLIVGDRHMLEESAQLIQNFGDDLEKSVIENGAYIQTNLVASYFINFDDDNSQTESDQKDKVSPPASLATQPRSSSQESEENSKQNTAPKVTYQNAETFYREEKYEQAVKDLIDQEKMRKNVFRVNQYFLFVRNVSFFQNFVIQKIITSFNSSTLQISRDLYFRVIFALCKRQIINLERVFNMLKSSKSEFNQNLWKSYQSSREFLKTQKTITRDIFHSNKFFMELIKKTTEVVENAAKEDNKKKMLLKFQEIMNDKFQQNPSFKIIFQQTLDELLAQLKPLIASTTMKDLLIIMRCLLVCQNPYSEFNTFDFDFNKYYEEIDNCQIDSIIEDVLKRMNSSS